MLPPEQRYLYDPFFRQMVDALESLLSKAETTPTEIRQACMLALIHYEEKKTPPWTRADIALVPPLPRKD